MVDDIILEPTAVVCLSMLPVVTVYSMSLLLTCLTLTALRYWSSVSMPCQSEKVLAMGSVLPARVCAPPSHSHLPSRALELVPEELCHLRLQILPPMPGEEG